MIGPRLYWLLAQINPDKVNLPNEDGLSQETISNGLRLAFAVAGAIAVIVVAYAGLKYILSAGDPGQTAKAKDTILYALIGLAVCIAAVTIITFITGTVNV